MSEPPLRARYFHFDVMAETCVGKRQVGKEEAGVIVVVVAAEEGEGKEEGAA